jgi:hypothetical protein
MRPNPVVVKKGENARRMVCAVTGKPVQSGATAVSLSDTHWCYVNPGKVLTEERRAALLASVADSESPPKEAASEAVAPKSTKKTEGDK